MSGFSYRSLPQLPAGEYDQFVKAWRLLASGNVLSLTRDGDMALAGAGVCEALLARSWAARYHDAGEMLRFASAAQIVARGLKTSDLGIAGVAALQARASGELANALRVAEKATEAASAFEEAFDGRATTAIPTCRPTCSRSRRPSMAARETRLSRRSFWSW